MHHYQTWNCEDLTIYQTRTNTLKYSFFPNSIIEWNKFSSSTRNSTYPEFRNHLLKITRLVSNGLKLLTRLRLGLNHLNEHRFNHNFQECINPLYTCSFEVESTVHISLHCHHYHDIKATVLNSLEVIDTNLLKLSEEQLTKVLLYGFSQLDQNQNRNILNSSIDYIVESKRFESSLFWSRDKFLFLITCYL